jgi:O-antigen/teichoic acid export membrane protein
MRTEAYSLSSMRRAIVFLIGGRAISAALTLISMLIIVRHLSIIEFGVYSTLLSMLGLALTYSGLGLDWVSTRYIPEYRLNASVSQYRHFILCFMGIRLASLMVLGLAMLLALVPLAVLLNIAAHSGALLLYIVVIVLEGLVQSTRANVFETLLLQQQSQFNAALRGAVFLIMLLVGLSGGLTLYAVVLADLTASLTACLICGVQIAALFARDYDGEVRNSQPEAPYWQPPLIRDLFKIASHNYGAQLIGSLVSANSLMLIGAMMSGPATVAAFGFCRALSEQISRYLPIQLLSSVVRPKIVAAFSLNGRFTDIVDRISLLYKGNLAVLLPLVIIVFVCGDLVLGLLSGAKYAEAWPIAAGFAVLLILQGHRFALSLAINIVHRPEMIMIGSLASLASLPCAVLSQSLGLGAEGLMLALIAGEIVYHVTVVASMYRNGLRYRLDLAGLARLFLSATLTAATFLAVLPRIALDSAAFPIIALIGPVLMFGLLTAILQPFTLNERSMIKRLLSARALA